MFFQVSKEITSQWMDTLAQPNWELPASLMQKIGALRTFFLQSPFFPSHIFQDLLTLPGLDSTWSIKTSGAGGEDALLVFGLDSEIASVSTCLIAKGWHKLKVSPNISVLKIFEW
jgi:hypothetical protein